MKTFTKVMKALSDTNRTKIVKLLQHKSMCVCELQGGITNFAAERFKTSEDT